MKILALETSTMMASCCVMDENGVIGEYSLGRDMTHSEKLVPMIKEILGELNINIRDIDLYGVSQGPGSFTGLRIGLASIKAFAHLYKKPVLGISTLEALAHNVFSQDIIVPIIDARRNRVYNGIYTFEGEKIKTIRQVEAKDIEDLLDEVEELDGRIIFNGNGLGVHRERIAKRLGDRVSFAPHAHNYPRASSIGELSMRDYKLGKAGDFYSLVPDYLRKSQAERELAKKEKKKR